MGTKKVALKGSFESIIGRININRTETYKKSKETISNVTKDIASNLVKSIENTPQQLSELLKSLKNEKVKHLEKLLKVDRAQMIVSNRKNRIYRSESGKMVIIDKDMWGEPVTVTIKENNKVIIKSVKFFNDRPFIFPMFNEKNVSGKIINMDTNEIWYQDMDIINVVSFSGDTMHNIKVKIVNYKTIDQESLFSYVNNYKTIHKNKKLQEIIKDKEIKIESIVKIRNGFIIGKDNKNMLKSYLFDEEYVVYEELLLNDLPAVSDQGLDVLFSKEILDYIKANHYNFENFKQNGEHIEYWQTIGQKPICVMRYKV